MNKNLSILKQLISDKPSDWLKETEEELTKKSSRRRARQVALRVLSILDEKKMTQTELATKMGVTRQQVSKIVKGKENFTFETIEKLEKALETTLMIITTSSNSLSESNVTLIGGATLPANQIPRYEIEHGAYRYYYCIDVNSIVGSELAPSTTQIITTGFTLNKTSRGMLPITRLNGSEIIKLTGEPIFIQGFNTNQEPELFGGMS